MHKVTEVEVTIADYDRIADGAEVRRESDAVGGGFVEGGGEVELLHVIERIGGDCSVSGSVA